MKQFTFKDFKDMDFPDGMPMEQVMVDMLSKELINVNFILSSYITAIEKRNHVNKMKFEEACLNINQMLSGNFKGEDEEVMLKRAIHTYNLNRTFIPHLYDEQYGYTKEDEKELDEFCTKRYGVNFKEE